jgi:hypothetical protein
MFTDCVRSSLFALSAIQDCAVVSLPKVGTVAGELSRTATPLCRLVTQHAGRRAPMNLRIPLFATYKHIVGRYSRVDVGTAIGLLGWASKGGQFTVRKPVEPPARLGAEPQVLDENALDHAVDPASSQPVGATTHRLVITPDRVIDTTRRIGVAWRWLLAFEGRLEPSARWNLDLGCSPVVEVELGARIRIDLVPQLSHFGCCRDEFARVHIMTCFGDPEVRPSEIHMQRTGGHSGRRRERTDPYRARTVAARNCRREHFGRRTLWA